MKIATINTVKVAVASPFPNKKSWIACPAFLFLTLSQNSSIAWVQISRFPQAPSNFFPQQPTDFLILPEEEPSWQGAEGDDKREVKISSMRQTLAALATCCSVTCVCMHTGPHVTREGLSLPLFTSEGFVSWYQLSWQWTGGACVCMRTAGGQDCLPLCSPSVYIFSSISHFRLGKSLCLHVFSSTSSTTPLHAWNVFIAL